MPASYGDHAKLMFDLQTAGAAGRCHARHHVPVGARNQHPHLSGDWRARSAPSDIASRQRSRETRETGEDQCLPRLAVCLLPGQASKSTPDGNGNLLDHSLYLYGSGMGNPDVHDHIDLPMLVAGGAAGQMKGARHIRYEKPMPLANVHLTLLDRAGVHLDAFADSTGKIANLAEPAAL